MLASGVLYIAAVLALPAAAPAGENSAAAKSVPQNWCFCLQYTGGLPPYFLARLNPPAPECAKMKYTDNGKAPQENGLLPCDELRKCVIDSARYLGKKKVLEEKTAQAKASLAACCAPGGKKNAAEPCSNKCAGDWEGILKLLAAETEKLGKAEQRVWARCPAGPHKAGKKSRNKKLSGK
ncbi:MAG: hypothetical protein NTY45_14150 [Elusimicrobia bacterium]|nr:hypothetical protein [Elusimicrobiota bacterium]